MPELTIDDFEPYGGTPPSAPPAASKMPAGALPRDATTIDPRTGKPTITVVAPKPEELTIEDFQPYTGPQPEAPWHKVGAPEAFVRGGIDVSTYGTGPAQMGLLAAGGAGKTQQQQQAAIQPGTDFPGLEQAGEGLHRVFSGDPEALSAYHEGRKDALNNNKLGFDQHRVPYVLGQLTSALAMPGGAILKGGAATARIGGAALLGAINSALQAAGGAASEAQPPAEVAKEAALSGVTGGVLGTAGGVVAEGVGGVGSRLGHLIAGYFNPEQAALRKFGQTVGPEARETLATLGPAEERAQQAAGTPVTAMDLGQQKTFELAQKVAKTSKEGGQAMRDVANPRFAEQKARTEDFVRGTAGGANYSEDADRIKALRAAYNPPAYKRAYAAGDRPVWSDKMKELTGTDEIKTAMATAAKEAKTWAMIDGAGSYPSVMVADDGQLLLRKGPTGLPVYPNVQYWDYVQRALRDTRDSAKSPGQWKKYNDLRDILLDEVDKQVPEFAEARRTAATFFGAENALDAGKNFVSSTERDLTEGAKNFHAFKPAEQEIFQRGFMSELATRVNAITPGDVTAKSRVLDPIFKQGSLPFQKIAMVMGPEKTAQLEAFLRVENLTDRVRRVVQEPNWLEQMAKKAGGHGGAAGLGALGGYEALKESDHDPRFGIGLGFAVLLYRHGAGKIDAKVATKLGHMLASEDPATLQKAIKTIAVSHPIMDSVRRITASGSRVGAEDVGPRGVAAGALMAAEDVADIFKKKAEKSVETMSDLPPGDQTQ